ncbi:MAG: hypothetical protein R2855_01145 [Thermomicrobiales bacterium]
MNVRRRFGYTLCGRLLVPGLAAAVVLGGSFEASMGQGVDGGARHTASQVIAQQLVDLPEGRVAFMVRQQTVDAAGLTLPGDDPMFLVGTDGSTLVRAETNGNALLLGAQEAAALAAGDAYRVEPLGSASLLSIELDTNPPDTAEYMGDMYVDVAGMRDMELLRTELGQMEEIVLESESGAGLLLVLEGSVIVEDAEGASALLDAGDAIDLDDSTPVSGVDPASVVLAVTLGNALDLVGPSVESEAPVDNAGETTGPAGGGQAGGTVPTIKVDSDGDGLYDDDEAALGSDPNNPDSDQDGLSDGDEVHIYGSSPTSMDTDGDGLPDYNEVTQQGTDPANPDTDGDGLSDHDELNYEDSDPTKYDSDGDGLNDLEEVLYNASSETPDLDGDGLTDYEEVKVYGSRPNSPDGDGDMLGDYEEAKVYFTNPMMPDSDSDGVWDYNEVTDFMTDPNDSDTDDDGFSDGFEINDGYDPLDANDPGPIV